MIFSPVCHIHTITLCMAWRWDSVDGVVTCYRVDSWIWTSVGSKKFSISATCLYEPWGPPSRVYCGKWPTFLGVQQSEHGADQPSHIIDYYIVMILLESYLCSLRMLPVTCYGVTCLPSTYMWLIIHELSFDVSAQKENQQTKKCEIQGIYKESFLLHFQQ